MDLVDEALDVCSKPRWLKVRYESGHTLSDGVFYSMRYRDVRFERWVFADLSGFLVKKEKPGQEHNFDIPGIGAPDEPSLFSWTQRNWPYPVEPKARRQQGWLASDDGAGEIADFIHYDFQPPTGRRPCLTLIHVKGSGSHMKGRGLSTSDYEVVVGQAVKNLRSLDRSNLADRLELGQDKQIATAVWLNGRKQRNRTGLIERLRRDGENFERRVVVLQPRVTEAAYLAARKEQDEGQDSPVVARLQQLDTLLVSAQADCRNLGAELVVVAAKRP